MSRGPERWAEALGDGRSLRDRDPRVDSPGGGGGEDTGTRRREGRTGTRRKRGGNMHPPKGGGRPSAVGGSDRTAHGGRWADARGTGPRLMLLADTLTQSRPGQTRDSAGLPTVAAGQGAGIDIGVNMTRSRSLSTPPHTLL